MTQRLIMRLTRIIPAVILSVYLVQCSSGNNTEKEAPTLEEQAWQLADSLVKTMSLADKAAQTILPSVYARTDSASVDYLRRLCSDTHIGGILLLQGDTASARQISELAFTASPKIKPFIAIDAEWGLAMRLADAPTYPANGMLSDNIADTIMYRYGLEIARESRLLQINMILGPVLDMADNSASRLEKKRSLGDDAERVARLGVKYARGLEDGGVISVAKHFPGLGTASGDSHNLLATSNAPLSRLDSADMLPFKKFIAENLSCIMVGHVAATSLDTCVRPASLSPVVMKDILRDKLNFKGLLITDALNMKGAGHASAWEALKAGADLILSPEDIYGEISAIEKAVREGLLPEQQLDEAVKRIIYFKIIFGIN